MQGHPVPRQILGNTSLVIHFMITVVGSYKGGSGKSTVTFNLALWLSSAGKSVVACDLDPQLTLTDAFEVRKEEGFEPLVKVYNRCQKSYDAEEVLIDVGTANMQGIKRALEMADRVLMPVGPSQADIWSAQRFLYMISGIKRDKALQISAFINRADTHVGVRESEQAEEALHALPGLNVLPTRLCQRTAYRRSFSEGLAVFELDPGSKAADEFHDLAEHIHPELT